MRGETYMKAVVITLVCVVASYLIFSMTRFSGDSYTIYKAVRYEVGDGFTTSGFLVRSEEVLEGAGGRIVVLNRVEGEKVGKGQSVAATYYDEEAKKRQERIDELKSELKQMEYAYTFSSSDIESATLDADILALMNQITVAAARREYDAANTAAEAIKPYMLRRYITSDDLKVLRERMNETQNRLDTLYAEANAESGSILAPVSGYFSAVTDGYESILTPAFLETATVSALAKYEGIGRRESNAVGKLVTAQKWYFAAIVPFQNVESLRIGSRIDVNFAFDFHDTVRMKVERISTVEEERCILVLSSESYIQNAVTSRTETADMIFSSTAGLRIPKSAIYVNDKGQSGVYVLVGAEARWKSIEILSDNTDSFIVKLDKSSTKNLWPEDEIILTAGDIFNGKVMVQ